MSAAPHSEQGAAHGEAPQAVRGLAVAADDLRLAVDQPELRRGRSTDLRFRIVDTAARRCVTSTSRTRSACT